MRIRKASWVRGAVTLAVAAVTISALAITPGDAASTFTKAKAKKLFYTKKSADTRFVNVGEAAGGSLTGTYPNPRLGTITEVTTTHANLCNNCSTNVIAPCPSGTTVISGGGWPEFSGVSVEGSRRSGNGWQYAARNQSGGDSDITAYAYCLAT